MVGSTPVVSVGLPVYNGAAYLAETLDSLLDQSFQDFELIISDNASTDATATICETYMRRDHRVRFYRQPTNLGAPRNYSFLVSQATGRYFKWTSASDRCERTFLARCVDVLEREPCAVLCYGNTRLIDARGAVIQLYHGDFAVTDARPSRRYDEIRRRLALNNALNGVIRAQALKRTRLVRAYVGGDISMMAELALQGRFHLLPDVLLERRIAEDSFSSRLSGADLVKFVDPTSRASVRLDLFRLHWDLISSIVRARVPVREKLLALSTESQNLIQNRTKLLRELQACFRDFRTQRQEHS
jgi:glycosyltransferase involved in cell wall biosynthesis